MKAQLHPSRLTLCTSLLTKEFVNTFTFNPIDHQAAEYLHMILQQPLHIYGKPNHARESQRLLSTPGIATGHLGREVAAAGRAARSKAQLCTTVVSRVWNFTTRKSPLSVWPTKFHGPGAPREANSSFSGRGGVTTGRNHRKHSDELRQKPERQPTTRDIHCKTATNSNSNSN